LSFSFYVKETYLYLKIDKYMLENRPLGLEWNSLRKEIGAL